MIYEYECENGHRWQLLRPVRDRKRDTSCARCNAPGQVCISAPSLIFNSDSFPSQALKGNAFWRPDGRNMYFKENDFLENERSDDAAAKPDTVNAVALSGRTKEVLDRINGK